jgi:hypothetical protein
MTGWRKGEAVKQRKYRGRTAKAPKPLRTIVLDKRSISDLEEIAYKLRFTLRTQRDYAKLLRKVISAGVRLAFLNREVIEGIAMALLESAFGIAKRGDIQLDEAILTFAVNRQLLLTLSLVYDFFEDSRFERIDELRTEYEKLYLELIEAYKKDCHAVLSPELANKTSTILGEILSLIEKEGVRRRSGRAL